MDAQALRERWTPMPVVVAVIASLVVLAVAAPASMHRSTPDHASTHEAGSAGSSVRTVSTAPWLLSRTESILLVRHGATSAELAAENQQRWRHLQLRMLDDPWVVGLLRHRPGLTLTDLVNMYLSRRS